MIRYALCSLALFASCYGQVPPTRIGQHHIGETFQDWLAITHDLDRMNTICDSHNRGKQGRLDKANCKIQQNLVQSIQDGKQAEIGTEEQSRQYRWQFVGGKLVAVAIAISDPGASASGTQSEKLQEEISFLKEAYGKPTKNEAVPYQNAYGETWQCSRVYWTMPDETQIAAVESITNSGEYHRVLTVNIGSKDALARENAMHSSKNPYK